MHDHLSEQLFREIGGYFESFSGSVNFGETRDFILKKCDKSEKLTIPVKHRTLLVMRGELQHLWEHSVPKRTKIKHDRINLTFKVIKD